MKKWNAALVATALCFAPLCANAQDLVVVSIVLKDGKLEPAILEVPAGKRIKIMVSNDGKTPIEFESKALKQERVLKPGAKATVTIGPLKPGSYAFFDEFHPDTSKGKVVAK